MRDRGELRPYTENCSMEDTFPTRRRGRPDKRPTHPISFRVDNTHLQELEKRASVVGLSAHEYARILVYEALNNDVAKTLLDGQERSERRTEELREDLALTLEAILVNVVKTTPSDEIRSWIDENLRGRG